MLEKTRAIILHHLRYDDSGVIVRVYTERFGLISFLTRSVRGKQARFPSSFLRPMTVVHLVMSIKPHAELHSVRESSLLSSPCASVPADAVACFIAEVLLRTQTDPQPDAATFDYLLSVSDALSSATSPLRDLPVSFLVRYAELLGFALQDESLPRSIQPAHQLHSLLDYYARHLDRPLVLKSLPVLHDLFN